jgi:hypothetical protein
MIKDFLGVIGQFGAVGGLGGSSQMRVKKKKKKKCYSPVAEWTGVVANGLVHSLLTLMDWALILFATRPSTIHWTMT